MNKPKTMAGTTFQLQNKTYIADRCEPLVRAVKAGQVHLQSLSRGGYPGKPLQKTELPGVLSVGFWDAAGRQDWGLDFHCNEGIELTFLETGQMPFRIRDKLYTLRPGKMTITRPWQPHALGNPAIEPGRLHWLILDVGVRQPHQPWQWPSWLVLTQTDLQKLTRLLRENETPVWNADAAVQSIFRQIGRLIQAPKSSLRISRLTVLINELLLSLFEILDRKKIVLESDLTTTQRTVEMFLRDLANPSLLTQEWTIQKMARQCHLGVTHFTGLCRKLTNLTPGQYLNYQRVELAAERLQKLPHRSITEIAFQCGFNSSQYFATVFKHFKGCTPRQHQFRTNQPKINLD